MTHKELFSGIWRAVPGLHALRRERAYQPVELTSLLVPVYPSVD